MKFSIYFNCFIEIQANLVVKCLKPLPFVPTGPMFREWLLTKIVNGERASYSAPKFARMQDRTRSQMLEDLVTNLQQHAETGQIPKPYR